MEITNNDLLKEELLRIAKDTKGFTGEPTRDKIVSAIYDKAENIAQKTVKNGTSKSMDWDGLLDNLLTSRWFGFPIMMFVLGVVFWITVTGANVPSAIIADFLFGIEEQLTNLFLSWGAPAWLHGIVVLGIYRTLAWVVSVMLPPMAIFFPLFTLLEDLGYLPRIAFNVDHLFKKAGTHGKQALTMSMGFGCNAAGIISCRIIESPREKLIAILTNNFVPCNGRFPTLIAIAMIFVGGLVVPAYSSLAVTIAVIGIVFFGILMTLFVSWILSKTLLQGVPSSFTLELPPYRKPQFGRVILRSIHDRTLFVLGRAIVVAAPAGALTWIFANINWGDQSLLAMAANFFNPFAQALGLDGFILMAFILGLPANEIVLPILIMSYLATGSMLELDSLEALRQLLVDHGWTWVTGLNVMLFCLLHYPCGTTLWTIQKETGSKKWTLLAFIIPTLAGIIITFMVAQGAKIFGLI